MLSKLEFHFDSHLTWSYMIDSSIQQCRQRLGCLRQISEYLGTEGLTLAYHIFVCPVAEYSSILMMGASDTQLSKLDHIQHFAEQSGSSLVISLQKHCHAAIGLLCKSLVKNTCSRCRCFVQHSCLQSHYHGDFNV